LLLPSGAARFAWLTAYHRRLIIRAKNERVIGPGGETHHGVDARRAFILSPIDQR
jgi:hypothetical protein